MSSFGDVRINVTHNHGQISLGDGNHLELGGLNLPDDQLARLEAAVRSLQSGAQPNDDGLALRDAVAALPSTPTPTPTPVGAAPSSNAGEVAATPGPTRRDRVVKWLLKIAPAAAGLAGGLLNPALGKVSEALASWVARQLGMPDTAGAADTNTDPAQPPPGA